MASLAHRALKKGHAVGSPCLEPLEERLLLTTLHEGEFFVYHNSSGDSVRVDLLGDPLDEVNEAVELFGSWENGITDLVGLHFDALGTITTVNWSDGSEILAGANWEEADLDEGVRGSRTEIWAIYFSAYGENTVLSISVLQADQPTGNIGNRPWYDVLDTWGATANFLPYLDLTNPTVRAPEGSGGAIVGSLFDHIDDNNVVFYQAVIDVAEVDLAATGVFAGGFLAPGITADQEGVDLGRIIVGGTIAGVTEIAGDIDVIRAGFLWGDVNVAGNLNAFLLQAGGGGRPRTPTTIVIPLAGSTITVQGTLGLVESRSLTLYSAIDVINDPAVDQGENVDWELSAIPPNTAAAYDAAWRAGELVDWDNDSINNAQFISHSLGDFILYGQNSIIFDPTDWYAISLMAGQTLVLQGLSLPGYVQFYSGDGRWLDSWGMETTEDLGLGSKGETLKDMVFTAREAGVYYLAFTTGGEYSAYFVNPNAAALGAVRVDGSYDGRYNFGAGLAFESAIAVRDGGWIGAISVSGLVGGTLFVTQVNTFEGGTIVAIEAGSFFNTFVYSSSNIGRVAALAGDIVGLFDAGQSGDYNYNAYIQNVYAAGAIDADILATGGVGIVEAGSFDGGTLRLNSDDFGPGGRCDLILIHGDWGNPLFGSVPLLYQGIGGDFGYVRVEGTIYTIDGGFFGTLGENYFTDGVTRRITDDGGGVLTIDPTSTLLYTPSYGYYLIGVEDSTGGVGGVIANLRIDGPATLRASGVVQIGHLDMEATGSLEEYGLRLAGPGRLDVYYLTAVGITDILGEPAGYFVNETLGDLVSGSIGTIGLVDIRGNLGPSFGTYGAWVPGHDAAPAATAESEPQFGWFHGTINGLQVNGDITELNVDGNLHDLRVTGTTGTVRVNADGITLYGQWHGVTGIVFSGGRLEAIYVGDGLSDDGGGDIAESGIFGGGSIGGVYIDGPRYEMIRDPNLGRDAMLQGAYVFGELNGAILAYNNGGVNDTIEVQEWQLIGGVWQYVTVLQDVSAIGEIKCTGGAWLTALVGAANLDSWYSFNGSYLAVGAIDVVEVSGAGAQIVGSEIYAWFINRISAKTETDGITYLYVDATLPETNGQVIGLIEGGGQGINYLYVSTTRGDIGTIRGLGPVADIRNSDITSTAGLQKIQARDMYTTALHVTGTIQRIELVRDMVSTGVYTGAIRNIVVGRDVAESEILVAGEITSFTIGRDFDQSYLTLQGPTTAYLKSMTVVGDISGEIISGARIGRLVSGGVISATITTLTNNGNVEYLEAVRFTGNIEIVGSLLRMVSHEALGTRATLANPSQIIDVAGDFGSLAVGTLADPAHLYADINVGGTFGSCYIGGTYYGQVSVNENLNVLTIGGGFGGVLPGLGACGSMIVLGELKKMSFSTSSHMYADLTVGGSISKLALTNASIIGNITSLNGKIGQVSVSGGNISGDLTAKSIDRIQVLDGNLSGDITVTAGNLGRLNVRDGNLSGNVAVLLGKLVNLNVSGGDATAASMIYAFAGIGRVNVSGGDLDAVLLTDGKLDQLKVSSGGIGGTIDAVTGIGRVQSSGAFTGVIRTAGDIAQLSLGSTNGALISAGRNVGKVSIAGNMTNTMVMAGYDIGPDWAIGGDDDNLLTGGVHSGNVQNLAVQGTFSGSIVAAGVDPVDGNFLSTADNTYAPGESSIVKMSVGGWANNAASALLADTSIDPAVLAVAPLGVTIRSGATVLPTVGGLNFGPSLGQTTLTVGAMTLSLTGAGTGNFNVATNTLTLNGTTSSSVLTITGSHGSAVNIVGADDARLQSLATEPDITVGDVTMDGAIGSLTAATVSDGANWSLLGGVGNVSLRSLANVTALFGTVGTWTMTGSISGGSVTIDSFNSITVAGSVTGDLTVLYACVKAPSLAVGSNLTGAVEFRGSVRNVTVDGNFSGDLTVAGGDLASFTVLGHFSGTANVVSGTAGKVAIAGNFAGSADTSFRALLGIGSFMVRGTQFNGLVSTSGNLTTLSAPSATFRGSVRAGGSIRTVTLGSMLGTGTDFAIITAARDLQTVKISGNMVLGWLMAGFDPGDGGYSGGNGGEAANNVIDFFTPAGLLPVIDSVGGGAIRTVTIGGNMDRSTIVAGVGPGADGYAGTSDDRVNGVGTIGTVRVGGQIFPTATNSYGVYAASNLPAVFYLGSRPFTANGTTRVASLAAAAGPLHIRGVTVRNRNIDVVFNHTIDSSSFNASTISLIASVDAVFGNGDDTDVFGAAPISFNYMAIDNTMRITLGGVLTWAQLGLGEFLQLTVSDQVVDLRGAALDGEFDEMLPSGDGTPGGDFVYVVALDAGETFEEASAIAVTTGEGTVAYAAQTSDISDIDVYSFSASAFEFLAVNYSGNVLGGTFDFYPAAISVFYLDDQGTADVADDLYEAVVRWENNEIASQPIFQAMELHATGTYYIAVSTTNIGQYMLNITLSASDAELIDDLEGALPSGEEIAYVSNSLNEHNNSLGFQNAKQLVYVNFEGGQADQYEGAEQFFNQVVGAFSFQDLDPTLMGQEQAAIADIMANVVGIFQNTPASNTMGALTVMSIDVSNAADWAAYQAADSGLWFTLVDPATRGLDAATDFTTVLVGKATRDVPGLLGIASTVDLANMSKGDNAIVFAQNFASLATGVTAADRYVEYVYALTFCVAHELGHTLGLNHHPTSTGDYLLRADDPDNDAVTPDDSNQGMSLMAYSPMAIVMSELAQLGTSIFTTNEFAIGYADQADQLLWWLA